MAQEERTGAVVSLIHELTREVGAPAILVGHSLGWLTATAEAEAVPEQIRAVVYLAAFMLPNGMTALAMMNIQRCRASWCDYSLLADPGLVGALRLDPRSDSIDCQQRMKSAFYGDLSDLEFLLALSYLHCDEPLGVVLRPTANTPARFGGVPPPLHPMPRR